MNRTFMKFLARMTDWINFARMCSRKVTKKNYFFVVVVDCVVSMDGVNPRAQILALRLKSL